MILLISSCNENIHELEFVKPIQDFLDLNSIDNNVIHYKDVSKKDLDKCDKVIICGTSLKDSEFVEGVERFEWLKDFNKPVFGICAGMQIIGLIYNGKLNKKTEIGYFKEMFNKEFLGISKGKEIEVWHLHNNYCDFSLLDDFEVYCISGDISQAVKHKNKEIYGVLFHPEVRNKEMILRFVN